MLFCVLLWFGNKLFYPYYEELFHWHLGNLVIVTVSAKKTYEMGHDGVIKWKHLPRNQW